MVLLLFCFSVDVSGAATPLPFNHVIKLSARRLGRRPRAPYSQNSPLPASLALPLSQPLWEHLGDQGLLGAAALLPVAHHQWPRGYSLFLREGRGRAVPLEGVHPGQEGVDTDHGH